MPKRILLLSQGRSCCHLLEKLLSNQANTSYLSHPFAPCRPLETALIEQGPLASTDLATQQQLQKTLSDGYAQAEAFFQAADADGKNAFLHTHPTFAMRPDLVSDFVYGDAKSNGASTSDEVPSWDTPSPLNAGHETYTNPTTLPDSFYTSPGTICILTTRRPDQLIPSAYRAMKNAESLGFPSTRKTWRMSVTYLWQVRLHSWLLSHNVPTLIVDAADFANSEADARKFMRMLCPKLGFEEEKVLYSWPKASEEQREQMPAFVQGILSTILGSEGIVAGKAESDGLGVEGGGEGAGMEAYKREFGEEGEYVRGLVKENWPLWEKLWERRLKPDGAGHVGEASAV